MAADDDLAALRDEPEFQGYLYPGGTHNPLTLVGGIGRASDFLLGILPAAVAQ